MKIILVAGARPNFMKVAPILQALRKSAKPGLSVMLVHSGQHYDAAMSANFFADLNLPAPDLNLNVGSGSHACQTAGIMVAFEKVCIAHRPDWVVVVGDVNSTLACALTAKKLGIRVAHVEAGLRSRDMRMPEEINRLCTDAIADLLFTTDIEAGRNLQREGIPADRIHFVGNTMIDTLLENVDRALARPLPLDLPAGGFAVLTLHRPATVDDRAVLGGVLSAVYGISARLPVVFPRHPRTAARLREFQLGDELAAHENIRITEPLGYLAFLGLLARARLVLTDSGGIQEETTVLGVPCVTIRENTERPLTCAMGTNVLAGLRPDDIAAAAKQALDRKPVSGAIPEKWDGHAAERIAGILVGIEGGA
jgi:UDP-N-acetylglucosamine 2-epimerase (non-hydrolysing)